MENNISSIGIDLDGILCKEEFRREAGGQETKVLDNAKDNILFLVSKGYFLFYWTARPEVDRVITSSWLKEQGFPPFPLFMGKPQADIYLDDRSVSSFKDLFAKLRIK